MKRWRIVLGIVGVLGAIFVLFWLHANMEPEIVIPAPDPVPVPNAKDFYTSAAAFIKDHERAQRILLGMHPVTERDYNPTTAELRGPIAELQPAVSDFRRAMQCNYGSKTIAFAPEDSGLLSGFRHLSYLTRDIAKVRAAEGNRKAALNSVLDGIKMSQDLRRQSGLIGMLVGVACEAIVFVDVEKYLPKLNASKAQALMHRLTAIDATRVRLSDTITTEKWFYLIGLKAHLASKQNWVDWYLQDDSSRTKWQMFQDRMQLYLMGKKTLVHNYTTYMDQLSAHAKHPFGHGVTPPATPDQFTERLAGLFRNIQYWTSEARRGLLLLALACQVYYGEHNQYPAKLEDLTPMILKELPEDPYAKSGSYGYRRTGKGFIVYSIGPDGVDDGGTPPKKRFRSIGINPDDKGDMILRVKR